MSQNLLQNRPMWSRKWDKLRKEWDTHGRKWDTLGGGGNRGVRGEGGFRLADMALFSRRKKSDAVDQPTEAEVSAEEATTAESDAVAAEEVPTVGISVQAFRGVGADAGPEVAPPDDEPEVAGPAAQPTIPPREPKAPTEPAAPPAAAPQAAEPQAPPKLPLAPALPPEQTRTVDGLNDNVLLREALAQLEEGATNEQLLGVMRQALQGHLYLRVHGDARQQISDGKPLSVGVVKDGDRSFMLAYSSGAALRASVTSAEVAAETSAIAQPVTAVFQQVVDGGFTGIILDNSSAPHRAVLPSELLQKALEQADEHMAIKSLLAAPRQEDTAARVGEALATSRMWVAVNAGGEGQPVGIAEARTPDGQRLLQLFTHPLEIVALGRGDKPMPFTAQQLASVLKSHNEMAGVLIDVAGPSLAVERAALAPVLLLAVETDTAVGADD